MDHRPHNDNPLGFQNELFIWGTSNPPKLLKRQSRPSDCLYQLILSVLYFSHTVAGKQVDETQNRKRKQILAK